VDANNNPLSNAGFIWELDATCALGCPQKFGILPQAALPITVTLTIRFSGGGEANSQASAPFVVFGVAP
jgi:hypothetical protein